MKEELKPCRDAFEKWCKGRHSLRRDEETGEYMEPRTHFAWAAWQAAWNEREACEKEARFNGWVWNHSTEGWKTVAEKRLEITKLNRVIARKNRVIERLKAALPSAPER